MSISNVESIDYKDTRQNVYKTDVTNADSLKQRRIDIKNFISQESANTSFIFFYIKASTPAPINTLLTAEHILRFTQSMNHVIKSAPLSQCGLIFNCEADGFLLVVPAKNKAIVTKFPSQINSRFSGQIKVGDRSITVNTNIGASIYPEHSNSIEELIRLAMLSAYSASKLQAPFRLFTPSFDESTSRCNQLLSGMNNILSSSASKEDDDIQMHLQPKYSLRTGNVVGFEALCRWNHKALGNIAPGEFIPLAEKTKMITRLTRLILRKTMLEIAENSKSKIMLPVAVNISAVDLMDPTLLLDIRTLLHEFNIPSNLLEIEVTETSLVRNAKAAAHQIENLRKLGLSVGIDDFGTGSSSLAYLSSFPVSHIKLDQLLTCNIGHQRTEIIIESILGLASKLGIGVIAEGVEDVNTLHKLQELSCPLVQGYLLGRPKPRILALSSMLEDLTRVAGYLNQPRLLGPG